MTCFTLLLLSMVAVDAPPATNAAPQRLTLPQASARVSEFLLREKPSAKIDKPLAITELTTAAIWDQLHVQVVQINPDTIEAGESFVLSGERTLRIGRAFGGSGVTSVAVADLTGDKQPLLIYTFAWGSGVHRSEVAILDLHAKEPKVLQVAPTNFSMKDYTLRVTEKGQVHVLAGKVVVGQLTAERQEGAVVATIQLAEDLPSELLRSLK